MRRMLIWVMLGTLPILTPVDWEEQKEWREWRQRQCDRAGLEVRRASARIRELERMPATDQQRDEHLRETRALVDALEKAFRCLQMSSV